MGKIIKRFTDNSILEYDSGKFDEWCVYYTPKDKIRNAPRDTAYFAELKTLHRKYPQLYDDFVKVYNMTTPVLSDSVFCFITKTSSAYKDDALKVDILLSIVYAGMVAEENKEYTILKKRIKRLGIHQVLQENMEPSIAATFSKGKKWRQLDEECKKRGF